MDETDATTKRSWIKRSSGPIFFVLVLLTYFLSEALLRRTIYEIPRSASADKTKLIQMLPSFLQGYLKDYSKRVELKARLKKATDPEERADILFELATSGQGKAANVKLMMRAIDEIPHSPKALSAWTIVLKEMSDEEIVDQYTHYVMNCDIRRPRQKAKVWQLGALALTGRSKEARLTYVKKMAERRVCSEDLVTFYEELWVDAEASGDMETGKLAKSLKTECAMIRARKMKRTSKKK